eukprot:GHVO01016218.1.p1 GENE.GHVO01016218.1~~GHVO01016218.1.p1  ORF type:complete len:649 (+),score=125.92 GHVO01016218.1:46-1947(+)
MNEEKIVELRREEQNEAINECQPHVPAAWAGCLAGVNGLVGTMRCPTAMDATPCESHNCAEASLDPSMNAGGKRQRRERREMRDAEKKEAVNTSQSQSMNAGVQRGQKKPKSSNAKIEARKADLLTKVTGMWQNNNISGASKNTLRDACKDTILKEFQTKIQNANTLQELENLSKSMIRADLLEKVTGMWKNNKILASILKEFQTKIQNANTLQELENLSKSMIRADLLGRIEVILANYEGEHAHLLNNYKDEILKNCPDDRLKGIKDIVNVIDNMIKEEKIKNVIDNMIKEEKIKIEVILNYPKLSANDEGDLQNWQEKIPNSTDAELEVLKNLVNRMTDKCRKRLANEIDKMDTLMQKNPHISDKDKAELIEYKVNIPESTDTELPVIYTFVDRMYNKLLIRANLSNKITVMLETPDQLLQASLAPEQMREKLLIEYKDKIPNSSREELATLDRKLSKVVKDSKINEYVSVKCRIDKCILDWKQKMKKAQTEEQKVVLLEDDALARERLIFVEDCKENMHLSDFKKDDRKGVNSFADSLITRLDRMSDIAYEDTMREEWTKTKEMVERCQKEVCRSVIHMIRSFLLVPVMVHACPNYGACMSRLWCMHENSGCFSNPRYTERLETLDSTYC